ncbi:DUF4160 domain-containing protein [Roseburia hominis]
MEHNPSHIHAIYGECVSVFDIQSAEMLEDNLPDKALMNAHRMFAQAYMAT